MLHGNDTAGAPGWAGTVAADAVVAATSFTAPNAEFAGTISLTSSLGIIFANDELEVVSIGNMLIHATGGSLSVGNAGQPLGFNGATPVLKPTVTGSRGGNAALGSLLTALASIGLITNSTSA